MDNILEMRNIVKSFYKTTVLHDVSLSLSKGEVLAICGENGAGKSTLMKILSGSYPYNSFEGEIYVNGEKQAFKTTADSQRVGIEMIYQEVSTHLDLTVGENIFLGNLPVNSLGMVNWKKIFSDTQKILDNVGLDIDPKQIVGTLSTSQQQMLMIARAYSRNPKIIVLDEPTSALTTKETKNLFEILKKFKAEGVSSIYISHKMDEVLEISDRVMIMRDGYAVSDTATSELTKEKIVEQMVGRKLENIYPKTAAKIGEEILRVEHAVMKHPRIENVNIVDDVSFSLKRGEILGFAGLVGAGRSELLSTIFGAATECSSCETYIEGQKVDIHSPKDARNNGIGFLTEDRRVTGLNAAMDIKQNSTLACIEKITHKNKVFLDKQKEIELAQSTFDELRIKAESINASVHTLSGGNQQKVVLAKWLLTNLKILMLDEPTRGIDVGAKAEIYKLMCEMAQRGIAVIMVSSEMPELLAMCDRILVMSGGKITAEYSHDEVTQQKVMAAAIANVR